MERAARSKAKIDGDVPAGPSWWTSLSSSQRLLFADRSSITLAIASDLTSGAERRFEQLPRRLADDEMSRRLGQYDDILGSLLGALSRLDDLSTSEFTLLLPHLSGLLSDKPGPARSKLKLALLDLQLSKDWRQRGKPTGGSNALKAAEGGLKGLDGVGDLMTGVSALFGIASDVIKGVPIDVTVYANLEAATATEAAVDVGRVSGGVLGAGVGLAGGPGGAGRE